MNKYLLLLLCALLFASCSIHVNGLYSDYKTVSELHPDLLQRTDSTAICTIQPGQEPKVYVVNASQLKSCMTDEDNTLVYIWQPMCRSQYCYPLPAIQNACKKKGVDLYIVAEYYNSLMDEKYGLEHPILGIDTKYYKASLVSKYTKRFLKDLTNDGLKDYTYYDNFLYFKEGKLEYTFNEIDSIPNVATSVISVNNN